MRRVWHALVTVAHGGLYAHVPCTESPTCAGLKVLPEDDEAPPDA
jgi:hypothetical protein